MDVKMAKGKVGQFFCKHKKAQWYKKDRPFYKLSGDTKIKLCRDCGKELERFFERYD
ncbi:hypothetical protein [Lysinibacillus fusiformis]|uniref:hypothetical protein n=1 Tax=Lysinibacillus fusiformis TaxID=28031 RepID=UPI001987939F|nr:hypothetical protein [Lysinibacillus fusiformis]MBD8523830.1 hypothetical protein [Lysinibacillus fusiformis]